MSRLRQYRSRVAAGLALARESATGPRFVHVYIARGGTNLENAGYLENDDAVRRTAAGAPKLTADPVNGGAVFIWQTEMPTPN